MRIAHLVCSLLLALGSLAIPAQSRAQVAVGVSVQFGPPALPVYEQPLCPGEGYIWTPGYWAWDGDDYYWVPGTWVLAPEVGFLWTPGYWGWGGGAFFWHEGYWGPHVGFYGGINYGFGYWGHGYEGGRWDHGHFYYNTYANRVNETIIHNTYNTRIENVSENRVSYNGGNGGINARPSGEEENYARERHAGPVAVQNQHIQEARSNPELRASANHGKPPVAATAKPGEFHGSTVPATGTGAPYKAPEHAGNANRPPNASTNNYKHATEVQSHQYTATSTDNSAMGKKYQQQQDKLAAKQNQEHQKLQQQQEREHQQMAQKNAGEAQKQQMEQRHAQQTQQLEQKHAQQQQNMQTHQQAHESAQQSHPPKH